MTAGLRAADSHLLIISPRKQLMNWSNNSLTEPAASRNSATPTEGGRSKNIGRIGITVASAVTCHHPQPEIAFPGPIGHTSRIRKSTRQNRFETVTEEGGLMSGPTGTQKVFDITQY